MMPLQRFGKRSEWIPIVRWHTWGEAMTYDHALWQQQDYEAAKKALLKLGDTPEVRIEKAKTTVEKDFLRAVEILYGEGSKVERDKAYAVYMGVLYTK